MEFSLFAQIRVDKSRCGLQQVGRMEQPRTFPELFDLWRTTPLGRVRGADIALSEDLGIKCSTVRSMRHRQCLLLPYWAALIEAARRHGADNTTSPAFKAVTAELLLELDTNTRAMKGRAARSRQGGRAEAAA